jgi:hypothetical protein
VRTFVVQEVTSDHSRRALLRMMELAYQQDETDFDAESLCHEIQEIADMKVSCFIKAFSTLSHSNLSEPFLRSWPGVPSAGLSCLHGDMDHIYQI